VQTQTTPTAQTTSSSSSASVPPSSGVKPGSQAPNVGSSASLNLSNGTTNNYCYVIPSLSTWGPYWLDEQDHTGSGRGYAPYAKSNANYPVYRNVLTYGVKNDGSDNQTAALQNAIDTDGQGGTRAGHGNTYEPAEVYLPPGIYTLGSTLYLRLGTIVTGDPLNPPIIKASSTFVGDTLINAQDPAAGHPETTFMIALRNVILDTTVITTSQKITVLQWGIGQACGLSNVAINMAQGASSQTGLWMNGGSAIAVTDVVGGLSSHSTAYAHFCRRSVEEALAFRVRTNRSISRISTSRAVGLASRPLAAGPWFCKE
jgi:glucan 1,3-beta-glucosidase